MFRESSAKKKLKSGFEPIKYSGTLEQNPGSVAIAGIRYQGVIKHPSLQLDNISFPVSRISPLENDHIHY